MSVLAVALNPTIDVSSQAARVHPTVKVRTHDVHQRPGGGGVNVASVVAMLGGKAELVVLTGGATGAILKDALATTAIRLHPITIAGLTRIAFMVREEETGLEYRFVPEGPEISAADVSAVLRVVDGFQGKRVGQWNTRFGSVWLRVRRRLWLREVNSADAQTCLPITVTVGCQAGQVRSADLIGDKAECSQGVYLNA